MNYRTSDIVTRLFTTIVVVLFTSLGAMAQTAPSTSVDKEKAPEGFAKGTFYGFSFIGDGKMPDALVFLPGPPTEKDPLNKNDLAGYKLGKELRGTLRGDTAVADARVDIPYYMKRFGEVMNKDITPENCPNLEKLLRGAMQDIRGGMQKAKDTYRRHRPYQVFKEHTPIPADEREDDYTSYPSGHSLRAWSVALIFVALDPAHQDAIMKVGYDMGDSRTIVGYHFKSDVEAARLCASASFARLCAEPNFWAYLQLARTELQNLK